MTIHDILNEATHDFETVDIPSARLDAEVLLSFCLGCDRLEFYKNPDMIISETQLAAFRNLIARRLQWEPVAYITGRKEFWTFVLEVNSSVLIPDRIPKSLLKKALNICRKIDSPEMKILDIGTGSGAIARTSDTCAPSSSLRTKFYHGNRKPKSRNTHSTVGHKDSSHQ